MDSSADLSGLSYRAAPKYDGRLQIDGIHQTIEIVRDEIGVPHIFAKDEHDGFFGQGFVQAQDRFYQMESDRLKAYGQTAALLGPEFVQQDVFWRRLQLSESSQRDLAVSSPEVQAMFRAFTAGVNAFLNTGPVITEFVLLQHVPAKWEPWDPIAIFKLRHLNMGRWEHKLWRLNIVQQFGPDALRQLFPTTPQYSQLPENEHALDLDTMSPLNSLFHELALTESDEGGSNNWVLGGKRTISGRPLLAGDPHRALDVPNVYYQNHVCCNAFDVIGFSFPGVPGFPHFAHNQRVAWSITHGAADTQDIFVERLSGDRRAYWRNGRWIPCDTHTESITVRGQSPISVPVTRTEIGPIIRFQKNLALAIKAAALEEPNTTWESLYHMLFARNIEDLDEAMKEWVDPVNNLLYADADGNIGYRMRGKLPIRSLTNAWLPVNADNPASHWAGFVPFSAMYRVKNPDNGYLVTANNQVPPDTYPHYIALDFAAPHRHDRIVQLITSRPRWSADDMTSIHGDITSLAAHKTASYLAEYKPSTPEGREAWKALTEWDGVVASDSPVASLYSKVRRAVTREMITTATSEAFFTRSLGSAPLSWQFGRLTGHMPNLFGQHQDRIGHWMDSNRSWERALDTIANREPLSTQPKWASEHVLRPQHPLSARFPHAAPYLTPSAIPMGGDADTVQAASYGPVSSQVTGTSVARYVFDLSNWDQSAWIVPLGVSGVPDSPHYSDQERVWSQHQLAPMWYSAASIRRHARHALILTD